MGINWQQVVVIFHNNLLQKKRIYNVSLGSKNKLLIFHIIHNIIIFQIWKTTFTRYINKILEIFHGLTIVIKKNVFLFSFFNFTVRNYSFVFFETILIWKFRCFIQVNYYNSQLAFNIFISIHLSSSAFAHVSSSNFYQIIII